MNVGAAPIHLTQMKIPVEVGARKYGYRQYGRLREAEGNLAPKRCGFFFFSLFLVVSLLVLLVSLYLLYSWVNPGVAANFAHY